MDKYVLFATFFLTVSLSTVFSAPLKFNINVTKYWQESGCDFPPRSFYNNISSAIWTICNVNVKADLLNLCNSLVIFRDLVCTMKLKTNEKMAELFDNNNTYMDSAKVCNSMKSDLTKVEKIIYDFLENRSSDDEVTIMSVTRSLKENCIGYCSANDQTLVMCGILNTVFGSLQKKLNSQVVPGSNDGKTGHRTSNGDTGTDAKVSTVNKDGETVTPATTRKDDASKKKSKLESEITGKPKEGTIVGKPKEGSKLNSQVTGSTTITPVSGNDSHVKDNTTDNKDGDNSTEINKQTKESLKPVKVQTTAEIKEPSRGSETTVKTKIDIDAQEPVQNKASATVPNQLSGKTPTQSSTVKLQSKEESASPTKELIITTALATEEKTTVKQQQAPEEKQTLKITTAEKTTVPVAEQKQTEIKSTITTETPKDNSSNKEVLPAKPSPQDTGKDNQQEGGQGSEKGNKQGGGQVSDSGKKTNTLNQNMDTGNSYMGEDSPTSGHFMAYFLTAVVLCVAGYVVFHNKQKIIAFIVEGRNGGRRSRRPNSGDYKKLQPSMEEVMPSLEKSTTSTNYIY